MSEASSIPVAATPRILTLLWWAQQCSATHDVAGCQARENWICLRASSISASLSSFARLR